MAYDLEAREALWNSQVGSVFSTSGTGGIVDDDDDFFKLSNDLISAHKTMTRIWWNVKSLEEYMRAGIIPRGLRIQIFPAWEVDPPFKKIWETGLAQGSKLLINLLIEHDRELLKQTKQKILALESKMPDYDQQTQVTPFQKRLKETLEKFEREIMEGKKKKYTRDKNDYEGGQAYRWKHTGNRRFKGRPRRNVGRQENNEQGDTTSSDFLGQTSSDTDGGQEEARGKTTKKWPKNKTSPVQTRTKKTR